MERARAQHRGCCALTGEDWRALFYERFSAEWSVRAHNIGDVIAPTGEDWNALFYERFSLRSGAGERTTSGMLCPTGEDWNALLYERFSLLRGAGERTTSGMLRHSRVKIGAHCFTSVFHC